MTVMARPVSAAGRGLTRLALWACALGAGLSAGVFFAFSTFVMAGLARLPPPEGVAAMQAINVTAVTPLFMIALMGPALLVLAPMTVATPWRAGRRGVVIWAGGLIYVLAVIGTTMACNVPMNDALAALDPHAPASAARWSDYLHDWTAWNHVRAAAATIATGLFIAAARRASPEGVR